LSRIFRDIDPTRFEAALRTEVRPELITDFSLGADSDREPKAGTA
jgi:hypothetical protein